jgi:hypothetical protein
MEGLANRIETPGVPRVTTTNSTDCLNKAIEGSIPFDRFNGIRGTSGIKTAGRCFERGNKILIKTDQDYQSSGNHDAPRP